MIQIVVNFMRYVILQRKHFLGKPSRWEYSAELNGTDGFYSRAPDVKDEVDRLRNCPYSPKSTESVRPYYWLVPFGHPMHRSAMRFQYGVELDGQEGLPWDFNEEGLMA
jgi:hypothetical protein